MKSQVISHHYKTGQGIVTIEKHFAVSIYV